MALRSCGQRAVVASPLDLLAGRPPRWLCNRHHLDELFQLLEKGRNMTELRITAEVLEARGACEDGVAAFARVYPDGVDIAPLLVGSAADADHLWRELLTGPLRGYAGWAIWVGLLPARVRANLSEANLRDANLSDANLSGANLSHANLSGAILSDANLSVANLSDANLSDANLRDANLRWADLSGANLSHANLRGADLSEADLSGAIYARHTLWPEGFDPTAVGAIQATLEGDSNA